MNWYALKTEPRREFSASWKIGAMMIPIFMPTDVTIKRIAGKAPSDRKTYTEKPLLPRTLFVQTLPETLTDLSTVRFISGAYRNALGEALCIPERQMVEFMLGYDEWFHRALKSIRSGDKSKRKPKTLKLADLADKTTYKSVMVDLFGIEQEQEAA